MLQFIFKEASPNAIVEINSPPHALALSSPLSGVDYDKHERSGLLNPSTGIFGDFPWKDKLKRFHSCTSVQEIYVNQAPNGTLDAKVAHFQHYRK